MKRVRSMVAAGLLCGMVLLGSGRGAVAAGAAPAEASARIDVNSASADELARLPGIGPSKAEAIIRRHVEEGAEGAGREVPPVMGYVRTAVGAGADERLAKEESFYRDLHDGYRNHFARLAEPAGTVGVAAENAGEAQTELAGYRALDTPVVRALASATIEDMSAVAEAAGPGD